MHRLHGLESCTSSPDQMLEGEELPQLEVYFVGSVSKRNDRKPAGNAAIVLGPADSTGKRLEIASNNIALPEISNITATEGHAASLGVPPLEFPLHHPFLRRQPHHYQTLHRLNQQTTFTHPYCN